MKVKKHENLVKVLETWGGDKMIEYSAALTRDNSTMRNPESGIKSMWKRGHTGPFETSGATIEITAPKFTFYQWHRHRTQSYNEVSLRVVPIEGYDENNFWFPEKTVNINAYEDAYKCAVNIYMGLVRNGEPLEQARAVLPDGIMKRMIATANLVNWFRFLDKRTHPSAQADIRAYAFLIKDLLKKEFPIAVAAWEGANKNKEMV